MKCHISYYPNIGPCPKCADSLKAVKEIPYTCINEQQGGNHYQQGIPPIEYIHSNDLNFFEGNAIKYITRNRRKKTPVEDLKKAVHYMQIQLRLMHNIESKVEYIDAVHGY